MKKERTSDIDITGIKQEYNRLLKRFEAGSKYLDDDSIPIADREERVQTFRKILHRLNSMLFDLKECGVSYTERQMMEGFEEVKERCMK